MATIITVHGTFDSGPGSGEKWWQMGSQFETVLRRLVEGMDGRLDFAPHVWDGLNSETSRRAAGDALYKRLAGFEEKGERYCSSGIVTVARLFSRHCCIAHAVDVSFRGYHAGSPSERHSSPLHANRCYSSASDCWARLPIVPFLLAWIVRTWNRRRTIAPVWLPLWLSLRHLQDEAIEGLRILPRVSFPIFDKEFAVAPFT
jgi:hypothetical protein